MEETMMDKDKLNEILKKHKMWLDDEPDGVRADLSSTNLSYADLSFANLSYADLSSANLSYADLSFANLSYADVRYSDLSFANLSYADLSYVDLSFANLSYADLSYVDLNFANLSYADLLIFKFQREDAYYQFDGKIRIGCEYHSTEYWFENYIDIGKQNKYTDLQIELYGQFITTCTMLEDSK